MLATMLPASAGVVFPWACRNVFDDRYARLVASPGACPARYRRTRRTTSASTPRGPSASVTAKAAAMAGAQRSSVPRRFATNPRHARACSPAPTACAATGSSPMVTPMPTMIAVKPIDRPMPAPARSTTDTRPMTAVSTSIIAIRPSCATAIGSESRTSFPSSATSDPSLIGVQLARRNARQIVHAERSVRADAAPRTRRTGAHRSDRQRRDRRR